MHFLQIKSDMTAIETIKKYINQQYRIIMRKYSLNDELIRKNSSKKIKYCKNLKKWIKRHFCIQN